MNHPINVPITILLSIILFLVCLANTLAFGTMGVFALAATNATEATKTPSNVWAVIALLIATIPGSWIVALYGGWELITRHAPLHAVGAIGIMLIPWIIFWIISHLPEDATPTKVNPSGQENT